MRNVTWPSIEPYRFSLFKKRIRNRDSLVEQYAGIITQIKDIAFKFPVRDFGLDRAEIGHIRIGSAGKGLNRSCGSGSSLSQRVYVTGGPIQRSLAVSHARLGTGVSSEQAPLSEIKEHCCFRRSN